MSPKPSRVLVTGGTGFLGAHIVDLLLERGNIVVVVTARSESKAKDFAERRSRFKDLLEVVITGDLGTFGAFDDLAMDVDVIIHCASPLPSEPSTDSALSKTIIDPAISGTLSILQASRKNPALKRLILTSSAGAILDRDVTPGPDGNHYTADDWNPVTYEAGVTSDNPSIAYGVGKKFAELEAWANVDPTSKHLQHLRIDPSYPRHGRPTKPSTPSNGSTFSLTVLCPSLTFGPWVHPLGASGLAALNYSNLQIRNIVRGDFRSSHLPQTRASLWVDVMDVALAHVEAALQFDPSGLFSNGRYAICSPEKFNYYLVGEIIREEFPEWAEDVLPPKEDIPPFKNISLDGIPVTEDLGVTYRSFRECIVDLVRQLRVEVLREAEAKNTE